MRLRFPILLLCGGLYAIQLHAQTPNEITGRPDHYQTPITPEKAEPDTYGVDTTGVYFHLRNKDFPAARRELARLKSENPGWQPPLKMLRLFSPAKAKKSRYQKELDLLAQKNPDACREISEAKLQDISVEITKRRDAGGALVLGWVYHHRNQFAQAKEQFHRAESWGNPDAAAEGLAQSCYREARIRIQNGSDDAVLQSAQCAVESGQTDAFETLGWHALDANRTRLATTLFSRQTPATEATLYGKFLALDALKQNSEAETLACTHATRSARLKKACIGVLSRTITAAYESGDYDLALTTDDRLHALMADPRDLSELEAWAALRAGRLERAARIFDRMLTGDPENRDIAVGLAQSLRADPTALRLARRKHPGLDRLLRSGNYREAFIRKQFDRAFIHGNAPALHGRDTLQFEMGADGRNRLGTSGTSRLRVLSPHVGVTTLLDDLRIEARIASPYLQTSTLDGTTDFGGRPAADIRETPESTQGAAPSIGVRREGKSLNLFATLGTTPMNAPVKEELTAEVGARWFLNSWLPTLRLFSRPVTDSLLSYTGTKDTATTRTWGRVLDRGLHTQLIYLSAPAEAWTLTAEFSALTGKGVEENRRTYLRGDFSWDIREQTGTAQTEHFRIGPFLSHLAYRKNLSHFTLGHGGYYSPQSNTAVGVSMDWLTKEGRKQQFHTKAVLNYEDSQSDGVDRFPITGSGGHYDDTSDSSMGAAFQAEAMWLPNPKFMLGGYVGISRSDGYDESFAGFLIRIPWTKRHAVISSDLPLWKITD